MSIHFLPEINPVRNFFKKFQKKNKETNISDGVRSLKFFKLKLNFSGVKCPKIRAKKYLKRIKRQFSPRKNRYFYILLITLISFFFGTMGGILTGTYFYSQLEDYLYKLNIQLPQKVIEKETIIEKEYVPETTQEEKTINVVKEASPSVVSIIITKEFPLLERYYYSPFEEFFDQPFEFRIPQYRQKGTEKKEIGGGTGFIISEDGMILTNRHVVLDEEAEYTVLTNEGQKIPAKVLAQDPFKDLAIIKIETDKKFKPMRLGNSDKLQPGQTVVAIGNALGEFRNTVSVGVVSGLKRTIVASGGGQTELLENVIQTDAAINLGNSGGPLLNLSGEVIGVNVAIAQVAENIGFAIPINEAKRDVRQVKTLGKIVYPFLGIYYTIITPELKKEYNLPVDYGAWIGRDRKGEKTEEAIFSNSAAQIAGLKRDDIILEFDGKKITSENPLTNIILEYDPQSYIPEYNPGDRIVLKILSGSQEKIVPVTLGERSE